jgi:hypothetical protein
MGGSLSALTAKLPSKSLVSPQQPTYLSNLSPEIITEVASYCSKDEIKALRGVCRCLDNTLLATFGSRFLGRLHLIPTPASLDILTQVSGHPRLNANVREPRLE